MVDRVELRGSGSPNGDCHTRDGIRGSEHVAATVKDASWVDHHARRVNFAGNYSLGFNLNTALGKDYPVKAPGYHHAIAFDLPLDFGALAENDRLLRNDVPFNVAINAE